MAQPTALAILTERTRKSCSIFWSPARSLQRATILVVFAPNTDSGFLDAITTAMQHPSKPTGISISWGASEDTWTSQALSEFNQAFEEASTMGITVTAAAGDDGSTDGETDGLQHCDFPASSPYVLACGGTTLESSDGEITSETVWNSDGGATGGGISEVFPYRATRTTLIFQPQPTRAQVRAAASRT